MSEHDEPSEPSFLSFTRNELRDYLRQIIAFFPENLPQKFSRPMLENILCPRGYWHDLDASFVQELLMDLRDEGLVNLVFREDTYLTFVAERKAEVAVELGSFRPSVSSPLRFKAFQTLQAAGM